MDIARLEEKLNAVADTRRQWGNIRHKLTDILVIGLGRVIDKIKSDTCRKNRYTFETRSTE